MQMNVTKKSVILAVCFASVSIGAYIYTTKFNKIEIVDLSSYPTFIASDTKSTIYGKDGKIEMTMVSEKTEYYASRRMYMIDSPFITAYIQNKNKDTSNLWHLRGEKGIIWENEIATISNNVIIYPGFKDAVIDKATTDKLIYNFKRNNVTSDSTVNIFGHEFSTQGNNFSFNLDTNVLTYKGKPHATYYPKSN